MTRVGIIDLRDLSAGRPWTTGKLRELLTALRFDLGEVVAWDVAPRQVMAVVVGKWQGQRLAEWSAWLRQAEVVVAIVDARGEKVEADPELDALERREMEAAVSLAACLEWDGGEASTSAIRELLVAEAARGPAPAAAERSPAGPLLTFTPGPWLEREVDWLTPPPTALARALCTWDGRPVWADALRGELIDLVTGRTVGRVPPDRTAFAISPRGDRLLERWGKGWRTTEVVGGRTHEMIGGWGQPIALAPRHQLAAAGGRCTFEWLWTGASGLAYLAQCAHDWPCGHGKKLYGYRDNDPSRVELAGDLSAYLSVYDVDAIVASALPFPWRAAGPCLAADWPPQDDLRALFHCPEWDWRGSELDDAKAALEEDVRGGPPAIALGPGASHRYAVGLDREVWRIRGEDAVRVGGPEPSYAVYDAGHREVRRAPGRLLCGAAEGTLLVVHHAGTLFRDDAVTGQRTPITSEPLAIGGAVPLPGTSNAVLYTEVDAEERPGKRTTSLRLRLV